MSWLNDFTAALERSLSEIPTIPTKEINVGTPQSVEGQGISDTSDNSDKKTGYSGNGNSLPPMREVDGYLVPDYGAWCSGWWRDCLTCPEYSGQAPYFCRKWNRTFCGVDDIREEYERGRELTRGVTRAA